MVAHLGLGNQIDHRLGSIGRSPLAKFGYRTSRGAGDGELILLRCLDQIPFGELDLRAHGDHGAVISGENQIVSSSS